MTSTALVRIAPIVAALWLALSAGGCARDRPTPADAGQTFFPASLPEAAPRWHRAYQRALRAHLDALAQRDDAVSQLDIVRLQPLLDGYYTAPPPQLRRERERALRRAQALAAPGDDTAFWLEAALCAQPGAQAEADPCDPAAALAHLQRSDADNAAVWLMTANAADRRGDRAGVDAALMRAAQARRYDIRYGTEAAQVMRALDRVPLPALDRPALALLGRQTGRPDPGLRDARMGLTVWAFFLPSPRTLQTTCRTVAAAPAGSDPDRHRACRATATLLAESDTLIGQVFGLALMAQLTADAGDGAVWRERLRTHYWRSLQVREHPALSPELPEAWRIGEAAAQAEALERAGLDTPPPGWLPDAPLARSLVVTGRYLDPATPAPPP